MAQQLIFILMAAAAAWFIRRRVRRIASTIRLGRKKPVTPDPRRWRNVLLVAFGQQKMFKRPVAAILHLLVYVGFVVINLEVLEFVIDGVAGTHRIFAPLLGNTYGLLMNLFEFLALAVLIACIFFLIRRNILHLPRFRSAELTHWPLLDANIILISEIVLMMAILTMNASDQLLQKMDVEHYPETGKLFISATLIPMISDWSASSLVVLERAAWWFHIIGILGFAVYITWSKHLHIILAFPNTWYARLEPQGQIINMPTVTREVRSMMGLPATEDQPTADEATRFGARDVNDLTRSSLLAAYTCTECGRCTASCPANLTGRKLSPRKIMMDVRDRLEEVGKSMDNGGPGLEDGRPLLGTRITKEEINACTSCNACVEACPVLINPLDIIIELRRYISMEESGAPAQWNSMYQNLETNFAPWKFSPSDRFNWKELANDERL